MPTTKNTSSGGHPLFSPDLEAEAVGALLRATGHLGAFETAMAQAANALVAAKDARERDAHKVLELLGLLAMRLQGLVRSVGERGANE